VIRKKRPKTEAGADLKETPVINLKKISESIRGIPQDLSIAAKILADLIQAAAKAALDHQSEN